LTLVALRSATVHAQGLRINQLRLLGTHNSYHLAPDPWTLDLIAAARPHDARAIDYSHRPLHEQLEELGLRHFELDLYLDPGAELFRRPFAIALARTSGVEIPDFDPGQRLRTPGIKVLHSPDFDYRTTVYTLKDGLLQLRAWSTAHPGHVPLFVLLELKSDSHWPLTRPVPWSEAGFTELEETVLEVIPRERVLTPDDVRAGRATLRDAVRNRGWPEVEPHRGKFVFLLDNEGALRDEYLARSETLEGRLLFVSVPPDHPAAAWMKRNDPISAHDEIKALVEAGFLVRTRADSDTVEARENRTHRREYALSSGAQLISTDYPEPDLRFSDYHVPPLEVPEQRPVPREPPGP
jgi:hypothetical protein